MVKQMILKLFQKTQLFLVVLLLLSSVGFAGNQQTVSPVVSSVAQPCVIPVTGQGVSAPSGYILVVDSSGNYIKASNGNYLITLE